MLTRRRAMTLLPGAAGLGRRVLGGTGVGTRAWPRAGAQELTATDASLEAASLGRLVRIGSLAADGPVTSFPMEVYVARVLAGEAEPGASDGAQEALAVAARTYTVTNLGRHSRDGFDLCDTTHCQVYRVASGSTRRAVLATAGLVLTYNGAPAEVYYSASCGGRTERAADVWPHGVAFPYLRSVEDDVHQSDAPWRLERTLPDLQAALLRAGLRGDRLEDVRVAARSSSGRAMRVEVQGLVPSVMSGDDFRGAIGFTVLRSTAFTVERNGDALVFEGRGYGHGVGMCVVGANRRGQRGERGEAILKHYFPALAVESLEAVQSRGGRR